MKFSLKLPDDKSDQNPLLKAKIPITIFSQPFTSAVTTAANSSSDLSFSLSSNFSSGPSLKLSYSPPSASSSSTYGPFSILLKSGLGLFGSPDDSPLTFSAHFSLSRTKSVVPTFSLLFKPQIGNFCFQKCTSSNPNPLQVLGSCTRDGVDLNSRPYSDSKFGNQFVQEDPKGWQELKLESSSGASFNDGIGGVSQKLWVEDCSKRVQLLSGIAVMARTLFPVTNRVALNFRWGMNFPVNFPEKMPYLTVNKVTVERVEEMKEVKKKKKTDDLELLNGVCFGMKRDLEVLEKENREMKLALEEMKTWIVRRNLNGDMINIGKTVSPRMGENYFESEKWRSNTNGGEEDNGRRNKKSAQEELKKHKNGGEDSGGSGRKMKTKPMNKASEVESELERAIKAASQLQNPQSRGHNIGGMHPSDNFIIGDSNHAHFFKVHTKKRSFNQVIRVLSGERTSAVSPNEVRLGSCNIKDAFYVTNVSLEGS